MHEGIVKWFNNAKGYGFIESKGIHSDIFVHFTEVKRRGTEEFISLQMGQQVWFSYKQTEKGLVAFNVLRDKPEE